MNPAVTSKEMILGACREIIMKQGWAAINIRAVAAACDISVGSVYNYFDSKSDLVAAAVESVWCDIFHVPENQPVMDDFIKCVEWIFDSMRKGDEKYPGFFNLHSVSFMGEEKTGGQQLMAQSWGHIQEGLCTVLRNDKKIRQDVFDKDFTRQKFSEIIFSLIISALLRHDYDHTGIDAMIRKVIYE